MEQITFIQVLEWCWDNILAIAVFLSIFIEIIPVKFNPIESLMKLLFKPIRKDISDLNKEVSDKIEKLQKEIYDEINTIKEEQRAEKEVIEKLITSTELAEISRVRWEIIEFANTIENGQLHVRDEYRHIIDNATYYHDLIRKHDLTNGIIDEELDKIKTHYEKNKNNTSVYF